jgi:hypothetical protein
LRDPRVVAREDRRYAACFPFETMRSSAFVCVFASLLVACSGAEGGGDPFSSPHDDAGARDSHATPSPEPSPTHDAARPDAPPFDTQRPDTTPIDTGSPPAEDTAPSGLSCSELQWWNVDITYGPWMDYGWWDTDLAVDTHTRVQLRHDAQLYAEGVYDWGWMPEFTDQTTGKKFRFLHLQPTAKYTTEIGKIYPAGTIVGLSGGDSPETGFPVYSTGEHLCVQTLDAWLTVFPPGKDACH